ncbi:MAG: ribonuclease HII [Saprospiraceae bacterium]|jgi:ribonuclease HII
MILSYTKKYLEAGCDEAGRGCLAGPVFAAAVILPQDFFHPLLNDSKLLKEKDRLILRAYIEQNAVDYAVGKIGEKEIDRINILNASIKAMHLSIRKLKTTPEYLLIDGNQFKPFKKIPHQCIVKGDSKYASIAAASILAKTYRDDYMVSLSQKFPQYGWSQNKGYGTLAHRVALQIQGATKHHRKTFHVKKSIDLKKL